MPDDSAGHDRCEVFFSGRVQGVGFRYTARDIAERFNVTGFVRNLPDGRVHLVAEGPAGEPERFVQAVGREMERFVSRVDSSSAEATGEFADFSIRF